jgi:hypothetical protein
MHQKSQSCSTLPDTSALGWAPDSESPLANKVLPLSPTWEEKQSFDPAFQTLLAGANQELATPLREAHTLVRQRQIKTFVECVLPIIDKHLAGGA